MKNTFFVSILVFLFVKNIFSQTTNFYPIDLSENYFASQIFADGIGNLGFDNKTNYYNPHYRTTQNSLDISLSGNMLIKYSEKSDFYNETTKENNFYILPDVSISYKLDNLLFDLNFINSMISNQNYIIHPYEYKIESVKKLQYNVSIEDPKISLYIYNIQLSAVYPISDEFMVSLGLSTNYFNRSIKFNNSKNFMDGIVEYTLKPFEEYQILGSLNLNISGKVKSYLYVKSSLMNIETKQENVYLTNEELVKRGGNINYPGILSAGVQYIPYDILKLSLEYYSELNPIKNVTDYKFIIPGINFSSYNFDLGVLFAYQISKGKISTEDYFSTVKVDVDKSDSFFGILSLNFNYGNIDLYSHFQFINKYYFSDLLKRELLTKSQILKVGVGIGLF